MTMLVVGVNHHSAPIEMLEAVSVIDVEQTLQQVLTDEHVGEGMVLSTCNRIEVYAAVSRFHPAVEAITDTLRKATGISAEEMADCLFVHYDEAAVRHAFRVCGGLDSMVVGDEQILGQFREALRKAQDEGAAGRGLNDLAQQALRVGKRVQTTTGIGRHGASVVEVALAEAARELGGLRDRKVVILGSGSMCSLAAAVVAEAGARITVVGRTAHAVQRLAASAGGRAATLADLDRELADADVLVSATGATGLLITKEQLEVIRGDRTDPLVVCDLALPHDTDPLIADLPGVTRLDIAHIGSLPGAAAARDAVEQAEEIVLEETSEFANRQTMARVEPIVAALRARAEDVLDDELKRLRTRLSGVSDEEFREVSKAMRRAVNTLIHTPTVRMKEFAAEADGDRYARALHALFDLDPGAVTALTQTGTGRPSA